mmetsp:Transcript_20752/g.41943  ORF Transcript_20752/g.41943 Transcript_20752/m.41943 type:complete len:96 (+) Transcript_20752:208-495(+)
MEQTESLPPMPIQLLAPHTRSSQSVQFKMEACFVLGLQNPKEAGFQATHGKGRTALCVIHILGGNIKWSKAEENTDQGREKTERFMTWKGEQQAQ